MRHNESTVLRGAASSLLSLVVTATFLWGGCVSCEQYFMFPGKRQPCCNQSGQCERPSKTPGGPEKQDCNRLPLQRGDHGQIVPLPAILPAAVAPQVPLFFSATLLRADDFEALVDPSPPDLQALHATFLI
jgi:hypothetical protein